MNLDKIDVLFFERPLVDLKRYAFRIASDLKVINPEISLASISIELPKGSEGNSVDYHFLRSEVKDIDTFLTERCVQAIVFTNPRIPDMEMILHAHKQGVKTVMIQEGVIFEGANINDVSVKNAVSSLRFIPKMLSYFNILRRMCRYDNKSYVRLIKEILEKKHNITSIVAHYFSPYLIGDYVLTMGKHWDDYYTSTMLYPKDRIRIMGDHDLDGFTVHEQCEPAICYVATVLVEDGSCTKEEFDVFLDAMAEAVDQDTKLYIKLHPRSDAGLYEKLKYHNVEFIRQGELPSTNLYIGHRSTLLARALYESDNLLIWKFKNEKEDFFEQFAKAVCESKDELIKALSEIDINSRTNNKQKDLEEVYWLNPKGAIRSAAEMINEYVNSGKIS